MLLQPNRLIKLESEMDSIWEELNAISGISPESRLVLFLHQVLKANGRILQQFQMTCCDEPMIITETDIKCSMHDCTEGMYIREFKIELARFTISSSSLHWFLNLFSQKRYKRFIEAARKAELEMLSSGLVSDVVPAVLDNLERCLRFYQWQMAAREALLANEFEPTTHLLEVCAPFLDITYSDLTSRLDDRWHALYANPVSGSYMYEVDVK
jgi:hypothetical protein